jgi:hypothetical protein
MTPAFTSCGSDWASTGVSLGKDDHDGVRFTVECRRIGSSSCRTRSTPRPD